MSNLISLNILILNSSNNFLLDVWSLVDSKSGSKIQSQEENLLKTNNINAEWRSVTAKIQSFSENNSVKFLYLKKNLTWTRKIRSCMIPSLSSSLLFSVDSCRRPIKFSFPRFCTLPFLLKIKRDIILHAISFPWIFMTWA